MEHVVQLGQAAWPEFLRHGNTCHGKHLFSTFARCQILIGHGRGRLAAIGPIVPLVWNGILADLPETIDMRCGDWAGG